VKAVKSYKAGNSKKGGLEVESHIYDKLLLSEATSRREWKTVEKSQQLWPKRHKKICE